MNPITHRIPGLVTTDHTFQLPLDHANPQSEKIHVFAREVCAAGQENTRLPWLVFLQGGPGFSAPRPVSNSGWLKRALKEYRVLLLDQRGTGRSSLATAQTLARLASPQKMANYLKHFRADAIVEDAEYIRRELLGDEEPWSILGQSYGGFCALTYLSFAPHGLREAFITGGLPSLSRPADDVYRATYRRVEQKNAEYFLRYPLDVDHVLGIAEYLQDHTVRLPAGGQLTPRRLQQLGMDFGMSDGYEIVHNLIEDAFVEGANGQELNFNFLRAIENKQAFDTNPIYAILHESIYCQGEASSWSAERLRHVYPQFDYASDKPFLFTGEMVYPWMFDDYEQLRPLKEVAHLLAEFEGWPRLYDENILSKNTVPCAAAVYYNDMYVERQFSEETAARIPNLKIWVTSEYEHNGLRADGKHVLGRLIDMVHGKV